MYNTSFLYPSLSCYQCRDQCSGYWVQWYSVGFLCMCDLAGKAALEIPVASKLGTPRYLAPKPHAIGSHNLWLIISMVLLQKLYRRTMEPCTTTKTTTIIGQQLTSKQYQLEINSLLFEVLYLTTDIKTCQCRGFPTELCCNTIIHLL